MKTATLDRAIGCQDAIWAGRGSGKLLITGEDRMYGPSFMWGADTALVGIAAAQVELSAAVLRAWTAGDHSAFLTASGPAGPVRCGDVLRADRGLRAADALGGRVGGTDLGRGRVRPVRPGLPPGERDLVIRCLEELHR